MAKSVAKRFAAAAAVLATSAAASSCVVFDADFNLYALGINGADYNLGDSSNWANGKATALTTTGRPPFTGNNTQCFLSQYEGALYILDADAANPTDVYIYDAGKKAWSTQKTTANGADLTSMVAILDHDTNVFFGLVGNTLYQADFGQLADAQSTAIDWQSVNDPSFSTSGYSKPVMALAQNHIHFLDVPGTSAGQAYIFVIHYAYFQPEVQSYPATSGASFPVQHGQTASFFSSENIQQEQFAFIPDDASATYVVNVQTNTTTALTGPSDKSSSVYATSDSALVQLTSAGKMYFLPYDQTKPDTGATWSAISVSGISSSSPSSSIITSSTVSGGGSSTAGSGASSTKMSTTTSKPTGSVSSTATTSATSSSTSGAAGIITVPRIGAGIVAGLAMLFAF